ncbi:MAG: hypothetical protein GX891_04875 [Clostridiales bacterium]|nr:hypothetical protein [Clostridiales bacterium]
MNPTKLSSYLGFAQKANKIVFGIDNITRKKKPYCLFLVCESASERLIKDIKSYAQDKIPFYLVDNLSGLLNKNGVKAIAITDKNLAGAIIKELS